MSTTAQRSTLKFLPFAALLVSSASYAQGFVPFTFWNNQGAGAGHKIFVTSTSNHTGNLGGLTGADAICAARAASGGLPGTFKAILSSDSESAKDRLVITGAVYNNHPSPGLVAANAAALWSGSIGAAPRYDEYGTMQAQEAWTGSSGLGVTASGMTCNSWSTDSSGFNGNAGYPSATNSQWLDHALFTMTYCGYLKRLYCISQ